MQDIWKTYKTPIIASSFGLFLVFILAVVPLFGSDDRQVAAAQKAQIASVVEEARADSDAEIAALRKAIADQARTISDLQNRISNLDRGVTRTFWRSKENKDSLEAVGNASQRLSELENRVKNLDRGVTKNFWRTKESDDKLEAVAGVNNRLNALEAQMSTLNKAVPRMSGQIRTLRDANSN